MQEVNLQEWIDALRWGGHKQGKYSIYDATVDGEDDEQAICAYGVGCLGFGIEFYNQDYKYTDFSSRIIRMNDNEGKSFPEIADYLTKYTYQDPETGYIHLDKDAPI